MELKPESAGSPLAMGIMSGTSLDGADAVLAHYPASGTPVLLAHAHRPFVPGLREELLALQRPCENELHRAALAGLALADHYAVLVEELLEATGVDRNEVLAIGAHGQTVRHRPELGFTLQLNAPARLAELTGIDVVADFRSGDIAAGGQGAPLVPAFHAEVFRSDHHHRAVLNLGGIANLTQLPKAGSRSPVRGWDCGPGNVLLDLWFARHQGGPFDARGGWSAKGRQDQDLLARLLSEPWLDLPPPKSTGRDLFNVGWLESRLAQAPDINAVDVQATLAQFTALTVSRSIAREMPEIEELLVCGGGAFNDDLIARLAGALLAALERSVPVNSCSLYGLAPEHVEALAFGWLAVRRLADRSASLPAVTGAKGSRTLGAHYRRGVPGPTESKGNDL
ncbi:MAG: anhydro-N-acetylmuramic acid kinase [Burkholderiaceae bacterium]